MKPEVLNGILTLYGILIVYLLIQSLTSNTKEFAVPGASTTLGLDEQAWSNLHAIIHQLYSGGKLTIPGNVHIKGDLLVGTYKDETGVEKGWEDSIEHTCVWQPKKGGADTSGAGWINDSTQPNRARYAKPSAGGGVFSFRAGHADLHPICISRKQPRSPTAAPGTSDANSLLEPTVRKWNPTKTDDIYLRSLTDERFGLWNDRRHRIKQVWVVTTQHLNVDDIQRAEYRGTNSADPNSFKIRFKDSIHLGWEAGIDCEGDLKLAYGAGKVCRMQCDLHVDGNTYLNAGVKVPGVKQSNHTYTSGSWLYTSGDGNDFIKCNDA